MTNYDWVVLLGSIGGYFIMLGVHEVRAVKREVRAVERHESAIKEIQNNRALALGAVQQRVGIEQDITHLKAGVVDLGVRVGLLETKTR